MHRIIAAFTLVEALISLLIIGIASAITVPSYRFLHKKYQAMIERQQLIRVIRYARQQAISYQQRVTIQGDPQWTSGYLVSAHHRVLGRFSSQIEQGELIWSGFPQSESLQFSPNGMTYHQNGSFSCYLRGQLQWKLIVNKAGRVRLEA